MSPPTSLIVNSWRFGGGSAGEPLTMACACAQAMAVHAHDVALRDLREELTAVLQRTFAGRDSEGLGSRIAVIELQLHRKERSSAVGAWNVPHSAKKGHRGRLASRDSLDLALAIRSVVSNVEGASVAERHAEV